jgi:hypothetical protein
MGSSTSDNPIGLHGLLQGELFFLTAVFLTNQGEGWWIILGWILERWDGAMWTGLIWLRIGTGGELL